MGTCSYKCSASTLKFTWPALVMKPTPLRWCHLSPRRPLFRRCAPGCGMRLSFNLQSTRAYSMLLLKHMCSLANGFNPTPTHGSVCGHRMPENNNVFCMIFVSSMQNCCTKTPSLKQLRSELCLQMCYAVSFLSSLRDFLFQR